MPAPPWARLERQILAASVPACREFFQKYYDDRGYLQAFLRWGANDGPDDALRELQPLARAARARGRRRDPAALSEGLGRHDAAVLGGAHARRPRRPRRHVREGLLRPVRLDAPRRGASALQPHGAVGARSPGLSRARAPDSPASTWPRIPRPPNYDPKRKLIRSMINGSKGPLLRKATALDWVGDPFDTTGFVALHGENSYAQFLEHYQEYTDVTGDHFLNLVATTLPTNAYLLTGEAKYRRWIVEYMDAWLARMRENDGIIPSFVDLDGRVGGAEGRWWGNAYGWGFSPVNPVTGRREDRNRIPRALVGFSNALLVTGDRKYVDAWRANDRVGQPSRASGERPRRISHHARRGRLVRLAARPVECRRARSLVLVDERRGSRARRRKPVARVPRRPEPRLRGHGARARAGRDSAQARGHPRRSDAARQASRRQHARCEPGGDRRAGAADVRRARSGPRRRPAQRARPLFRSGAPARRHPGGRRRARLRASATGAPSSRW